MCRYIEGGVAIRAMGTMSAIWTYGATSAPPDAHRGGCEVQGQRAAPVQTLYLYVNHKHFRARSLAHHLSVPAPLPCSRIFALATCLSLSTLLVSHHEDLDDASTG